MGTAIRASLSDYYFNSLRLVAVNVVWGLAVIVVIVLALVWPLGALLCAPLLAIPTAGVFRLAGRIARGDTTVAIRGLAGIYRANLRANLGLGVGAVLATMVLGSNVMAGLTATEPLGLVLATLAAWGLVAIWCGSLVIWPLMADPARAGGTLRNNLRLASALLFTQPVRFASLGIAVLAITLISTVLLVAILTVSLSLVALVACRMVYPSADRLNAPAGADPGR